MTKPTTSQEQLVEEALKRFKSQWNKSHNKHSKARDKDKTGKTYGIPFWEYKIELEMRNLFKQELTTVIETTRKESYDKGFRDGAMSHKERFCTRCNEKFSQYTPSQRRCLRCQGKGYKLPNGSKLNKRSKKNYNRDMEIYILYKQGLTKTSIAKRFEMTTERVRQIVIRVEDKYLTESEK